MVDDACVRCFLNLAALLASQMSVLWQAALIDCLVKAWCLYIAVPID
jgi:hypothetical protein